MNHLKQIAAVFVLEDAVAGVTQLGEGFINDTFVVTVENGKQYILQRKNKNIFKNIPAMMDNIQRVTTHIKQKLVKEGKDPMRGALTVVPANDGKLYHIDAQGDYWAMCVLIPGSVTYESATTPELAYAGGKGIGLFQNQLSDFKEPLVDILPGFHNIRFRFEQWDAALAADKAGRKKNIAEEISWVENRRKEMLDFWKLVETGVIPTRVTHNDTKISNILFDEKGDVLCVIDLDTVLSSTALNDYGDAMRSYTNTGKEDDENLNNVSMSLPIFEAYTKGYLSEAKHFLSDAEKEYLAFSAKYITYEQVLRFLMDYIDGDTYYKVKSKEHNLQRTRAQYKLLQSMEAQYDTMKEVVRKALA